MDLSDNFDQAKGLSATTHSLLDEGIMDVYDRTLDKLEKLGVAWDPKRLKLRGLKNMLDETHRLNSNLSNAVLSKFRLEMNLRREKLAFLMDKVYYIKKHEKEVYNSLAESGII